MLMGNPLPIRLFSFFPVIKSIKASIFLSVWLNTRLFPFIPIPHSAFILITRYHYKVLSCHNYFRESAFSKLHPSGAIMSANLPNTHTYFNYSGYN